MEEQLVEGAASLKVLSIMGTKLKIYKKRVQHCGKTLITYKDSFSH